MSMQNVRFRVMSAFLFLPVVGVAGCDRAETGTGRTTEMRCSTDGLCWSPVGKRSFEGAYRRNDDEIRFDAIFSPGRTAMTSFRDEWSYRLIDRLGHAFYTAPSSSPPDSWITPEALNSSLPSGIDDRMAYLKNRAKLAEEMAHAVVSAEVPGGRLREPWNDLCRHLTIKYLEKESVAIRNVSEDADVDPVETGKEMSTEISSEEVSADFDLEEIDDEE